MRGESDVMTEAEIGVICVEVQEEALSPDIQAATQKVKNVRKH